MMAEKRRERLRLATQNEIKDIARRLMAENGTAGLGLRAIAREMDVTAPAIYRYFPSLDDLTTELILENFNAMADALESARDQHSGDSHTIQLGAVLLAYRRWAVEHPIDFQLIYGNPIPGYVAPREITVPAVVRGFTVMVGLVELMLQAGEAVVRPPYDAMPAATRHRIQELIDQDQYPIVPESMYLGFVAWTTLHGIIMLELFNHLQPIVGDTEAYYRAQVDGLLLSMRAQP